MVQEFEAQNATLVITVKPSIRSILKNLKVDWCTNYTSGHCESFVVEND